MRSLFSLLCLPLLLVFTGCSTPPDRLLEAPVIQVTTITAVDDTYELALRLGNANTVPLVVSSSTHTLYLGEQRMGHIEDRKPIGLPPLDSVSHTVLLSGPVAEDVRAYLSNHPGEVSAAVESTFEIVLSGEETMTLKSTGRGTVIPRS